MRIYVGVWRLRQTPTSAVTVMRVRGGLIEERGRPENLRSDNGSDFTSRRVLGWAEDLEGWCTPSREGRCKTLV